MSQQPRFIACPACSALNRIPSDRQAAFAKCGRCGRPLFEGRPIELTSANFDAHTTKSDIPLLVDFWASWCGPCRQMAPAFEAAAARLEPGVRVGKLDTEREPALAARLGIQSIPTLALLRHGRELARKSGVMPTGAIVSWVSQVITAGRGA